ncbi:MAG: sugar ABC transporter permease, partial [Lachnospiraceae bacterium]|nr:sugar ABC transporter permease [Lachnospiraceae bacterium]
MKKAKSVTAKQQTAGWLFLAPASILIFIMSFWPMIQAFVTSLKTGSGVNLKWGDPLFVNYIKNIPADKTFIRSMGNTYLYLIIEVPIMLILAILLAQILNNRDLKFRG